MITIPTQLMIWRWPSQNTFGMWTMLFWTRSSRTQFGVSINVWRLAGDTLNTTCNFLYHQVHRDFFDHPVFRQYATYCSLILGTAALETFEILKKIMCYLKYDKIWLPRFCFWGPYIYAQENTIAIFSVNPFRSYIGPRPTVWFSSSAPMSEHIRHCFCCVCSPAVGACPTLFLM
jgi:hypothetical protein